MRPMASDRQSLTVREVCELLRIHPTTVYKLVRQGKIPSFRIGSCWRFRTDLIERWMAEKSMYARQVRKVIESGANGKARHRSLAGSGRT
jgi:excisionase family DNA binding protein